MLRKRFGGFARLSAGPLRWVYRLSLVAAAGAGVALCVWSRGTVSPIDLTAYSLGWGFLLTVLAAFLATIMGAISLVSEHSAGTLDSMVLSVCPRGAIGRAIVIGTVRRALTVLALPLLLWFGFGATYFAGWEFLLYSACVATVVSSSAFMGACVGCEQSRRTIRAVAAVPYALANTGFYLGMIGCSATAVVGCLSMKKVALPLNLLGLALYFLVWGWAFYVDYTAWFDTGFDDYVEEAGESGGFQWW